MARPDPIVTPEGWLHRGAAYVSGEDSQLAVFGGIPGERARVKVVGRAGRQAQARWISPAGEPHPLRVKPACDRFAPCGGCPIMHLSAEGQDRMRRSLYRDALREVGLDLPVDPPARHADHDVLHALSLVAGRSDRGHPRLGVRGNDGREVVPIPQCLVVTPSLREVMKVGAHHLLALEVWPWDGRSGTLRAMTVRESPTTGDVQILLGVARPNPVLGAWAQAVASAHPPVSSVLMHIHEARGAAFQPDPEGDLGVSVLYGRPTLPLAVDGVHLQIAASDPFPVHPRMEEEAARAMVAALGPEAEDAVIEIGAGNGATTQLLARAAGWALGFDPRETVAHHARENAAANGIGAEFAGGPYEETLPAALPRLAGRRPLVLAHAGTRGLDAGVVAALRALSPRRVVVTGTNPRSFARAVAALAEGGAMVPEPVQLWDVAPHTPFVLASARLVSTDRSAPERRAPRRRAVR